MLSFKNTWFPSLMILIFLSAFNVLATVEEFGPLECTIYSPKAQPELKFNIGTGQHKKVVDLKNIGIVSGVKERNLNWANSINYCGNSAKNLCSFYENTENKNDKTSLVI